ncbi:hypothetical protein TBK1r_01930 [Stieleria magnilauensis]|uniref:Uncharacterized protein n=1 Tax=Stieleria magnilauensis TaxID=2527963 RepID=A0ABX5XH04_9BACT|nr:hypothetical protein TBK1r_01930 [Planctomycetes bacterium TBK1r]
MLVDRSIYCGRIIFHFPKPLDRELAEKTQLIPSQHVGTLKVSGFKYR